ncbi:MAG: tetratricopeptide repeat protein [Alphaproteobacteria bacterium]|nr:MAG: tetratricopeptide repeat protein [Alphaproteobacteria bacterium]
MYGKSFCGASLFLIIALFLLPPIQPAGAEETTASGESPRVRYQNCLAQTKKAPELALENAFAWRDEGGGFPARHCVALALVAMKKYDIAAPKLEELAEDMRKAGSPLLVPVLSQAANVWLLAGNYERAEAVATAALEIEPQNIDLLIDRSRIRAKTGNYQGAYDDLDLVLKLDPTRTDALTFRAAALRQLGQITRALEDVELALSLEPGLVDALAERGILYHLTGKDDLARKDWLAAINLAPKSPAADLARLNLENLDVHTDK